MNCLLNHTRFILVFLFISWSLNAQVALPTFQGVHASVDKPAENPLQSSGVPLYAHNQSYSYLMGYRFTPQVNGKITQLGGYFDGTKTVYLWQRSNGSFLGSASISDPNNNWVYADITTVAVTAGTEYVVAVAVNNSGGSRNNFSGNNLPNTYGNITINYSCYVFGWSISTTYPSSWTSEIRVDWNWGRADITFVPD